MTIPRTEQTKLARTDEHVGWRTAKYSVDEKSGEIYLLLEVQRVWDLRSVWIIGQGLCQRASQGLDLYNWGKGPRPRSSMRKRNGSAGHDI